MNHAKIITISAFLGHASATVGQMCCGDNFCCSLNSSSAMECWGGNTDWTPPSGSFKAISCAGKAGVAINSDDTIGACYGSAGYGSEGCTTGEAVIDASTSFWGGCAIKSSDDTIMCWGPTEVYGVNSVTTLAGCSSNNCDAVNPTITPPSGTFKSISCSGKRAGHFCCATGKDDDLVECFGAGSTDYTPPASSYPTVAIHQLSCGTDFCCGLTPTTGNLHCFGNLEQAGYDGSFEFMNWSSWFGGGQAGSDIPAYKEGPYVQVASGNFATYALKADSSIDSFGMVFDRDVGPVEAYTSTIDLPYASGWTSLGTNGGFGHACASVYKSSSSDQAACWGADYRDQVTNAPTDVLDDGTAYFYPARIGTVTQVEPTLSVYHKMSLVLGSALFLAQSI